MPAVDAGEAATRGFSGAGFDVGAAATTGAVCAGGAVGSSRVRGRTAGTTAGFDCAFGVNATGTGTEITAGIERSGGAACTGWAIGTAVHAVSGDGAPAMSGARTEAVGVTTTIVRALDLGKAWAGTVVARMAPMVTVASHATATPNQPRPSGRGDVKPSMMSTARS